MQDVALPLSRREIEQLQEIVIRAHYLALEIRQLCAASGLGAPELSQQVGLMLQRWALEFGKQIDAAEPAKRRRRRFL